MRGRRPINGEIGFSVEDQPIFAVAGFWQPTAKGNGLTMVTCDPNELVAPIHSKAMIPILREVDWERWLESPRDDVVAFQRPYPAELMTVRGPLFPDARPRQLLSAGRLGFAPHAPQDGPSTRVG